MADVFISYSRRDKEFVWVLHEALVTSKYDAWVDWQKIAPTTEWWEEILLGIREAHTFIFVISPDSVTSKYCLDEVAYALERNKRIIPVLRRSASTPKVMSHIQWLPFREEDPFEYAFEELINAINVDLEHNKTHTRLENRAKEWAQKDRDINLLLRGNELEAAEQWLLQSTDKTPKYTGLQKEYITTGRQVASNRQRLFIGNLLSALVLTGGLSIFAFFQYQAAQAETSRAETATVLAELQLAETQAAQKREAEQRTLAEANEAAAKASAAAAQRALTQAEKAQQAESQQRQRAEQALIRAEEEEEEALRQAEIARRQTEIAQKQTELAQEQARRAEAATKEAILQKKVAWARQLAIQAAVFNTVGNLLSFSNISSIEPELTLQLGLDSFDSQIQSFLEGVNPQIVRFSPNNRLMAVANRSTFFLVDITNGSEIGPQYNSSGADRLLDMSFSPDARTLATAHIDGSIRLWSSESFQLLQVFEIGAEYLLASIAFSPDGRYLASISDDKIQIWSPETGTLLNTLTGHTGTINSVDFSPNGDFLITASRDNTVRVWSPSRGLVAEPITHQGPVYLAVFGPEQESIGTVSGNSTVRIIPFNQ